MSVPATTSQTVGPYFKIGLSHIYNRELAGSEAAGDRITIQGRVLDGEGNPVPDAVLEIWQADAEGNYCSTQNMGDDDAAARVFGFGRVPTGEDGAFSFSTIKPGSVEGPDGSLQAPHLAVSIFMRGLLARLVTRIYFSGDPRNENDCVFKLVEEARRATLLAVPVADNPLNLVWNVFLQGKRETVFFEI